MISLYQWKRVREMYFHEKQGIKTIARKLKISKNTVRSYIRSNEEPVYHGSQKRDRKISCYSDLIKGYLEKGFIGTVIYENLKDEGYEGSLISLYRYLRDIGWKEKESQTTRFETLPGEQMQYDWKEWRIKIAGEETLIYLHCLILGYSRMKYYSISFDKTSDSVIRAILGGMEYFCGYCEKLLMDNGKSMVLNHNKKRRGVEFNDDFIIFTGRYNIKPVACFPRRAQTKGKVERPFYYIQEHLLRGLEVKSIEELELQIIKFNDKVNSNFHSTLNKTPLEAFEEEKIFLKPYERMDLSRIFLKDFRKVTRDGYVSYKTNFYPVPMQYCNQSVLVENVMGKTLKIYGESMELLKSYSIEHFRKNYRPEHPEHIILRNEMKEKVKKIKSNTLKTIVKIFGNDGEEFIQGVEERKGVNSYYHLATLLDYVEIYGEEIVKEAVKNCVEMKVYDKKAVKMLLSNKLPELSCTPAGLINFPVQKIKYNMEQYEFLGRCN